MDIGHYESLGSAGSRNWWFRTKREIVVEIASKERLKAGKPLKILDIGCGVGDYFESYSRLGEVTGVDSEPRLKGLFKKSKKGKFKHGHAEKLPFPDSSFDFAVAGDIIEHVKDDARAVHEAYRVLEPGGLLVANVPTYQALFGPSDLYLRHYRRYNAKTFSPLFKDFNIEYLGYWNLTFLAPAAVLKLAKKILGSPPSSDSTNPREPINGLMHSLLAPERAAVSMGIRLPAGTSLLCVARKPA